MDYLLVDGYNVINSWTDIFDLANSTLEDCRDKLLNIMSNYQGFRKINIIVVFDAHMVKGSQEKQQTFDNIEVVFTRENETADNYIERFVYKMGNIHTIRVVTLDYMEQTTILNKGGIRITPGELKHEILTASKDGRNSLEKKPVKSNSLASRIKPELVEKLEKMRRNKF